ncbi:hypothetical protein ACFQI7_25795 [Paenibacillus allorhizosphaerae]|uniref:DUF4357 domain-containing protein n=1 Tax=Paenibacillus allorhizosphaerae TaxID=2849866 RepID=A0ABM8VJH3_9BACL|nr:hypothetical protein [Paenibacillus allorhizosphaerae]CAG7645515.1 hypothetical protein PAECIP111802_03535 [Paenibacillus allorhizosphaerae]
MTKQLTIRPAAVGKVEANVYLNQTAKGYYDKSAKRRQMLIVLPGSMFTDKHAGGWIPDNLDVLTREGYLEKKANGYLVLKPVCGSPSGTAAAILGKDGPGKPSGFLLWTFPDGRTIAEAGEKPK